MIPGDSYLAIYLNDHLAGATGGLELARRAARENPGGEFGAFLRRLAEEVEEDRNQLIRIMQLLEVGRDRVKVAGGWTAEKLGRLKPNGHIRSYSPLSRVVELDGLIAGVSGKLTLWHALLEVSLHDDRLDSEQLEKLAQRAELQIEELRRHHRSVSRETFVRDLVTSG